MNKAGSGFVLEGVTVARGSARILERSPRACGPGGARPLSGRAGRASPHCCGCSPAGRPHRRSGPARRCAAVRGRRAGAAPPGGLVAQHPVLLTDRVADDIRLGRPKLSGDRVAELLTRVGLPTALGERSTEGLSGGEAQRVCLARALAVEPEVLLLDELTSGLNGVHAGVVADLARGHLAAGGTVVLVSHNLAVVRGVADRVLVLDSGCLAAAGRRTRSTTWRPGDVRAAAAELGRGRHVAAVRRPGGGAGGPAAAAPDR